MGFSIGVRKYWDPDPPSGGSSKTPAPDAAPTASGSDSTPTSGSPTPEGFFHEDSFKKGYGKGADKGRNEGIKLTLESLGLPTDIDAAKAHVESFGTKEPAKKAAPVDVRETDEYRSLATEHTTIKSEYDAMKSRLESLSAKADQARVEKFKSAALAKGVGEAQLPALLALHGERVRMSDDGELEVQSEMPDGSLAVAGVTVGKYLDDITTANPWMLAPQQASGAGSHIGPTSAPPQSPTERGAYVIDNRSVKERLKR
jgi:hypothetical protein